MALPCTRDDPPLAEPGAAQGVHRDPGPHRVHHARLLADDVAGARQLHRHG